MIFFRRFRESLFAAEFGRITESATTDEHVCIMVAGHICSNMRNGDESKIKTPLEAWEQRLGLCGYRSRIMAKALELYNIKARIIGLYAPGFVHTCIEAYYDGEYHFFDPTYGGYFISDGRVLPWGRCGPESRMVVFPKTRDVWSDGTRVNNHIRMAQNYNICGLFSPQVIAICSPYSKRIDS